MPLFPLVLGGQGVLASAHLSYSSPSKKLKDVEGRRAVGKSSVDSPPFLHFIPPLLFESRVVVEEEGLWRWDLA